MQESDGIHNAPDNDAADTDLVARTKSGDANAYAELFRRHYKAGLRTALSWSPCRADAEDMVAEAFCRVLTALLAGGGPSESFRGYLLKTIGHLGAAAIAKARRESPSLEGELDLTVEEPDPVVADFEHRAALLAFQSLPTRWRTVLWYREVDDFKPSRIGPLIGLAPNAVSALAKRAREGLKQAYLLQHLSEPVEPACYPYRNRLAAYARGKLKGTSLTEVQDHLRGCCCCRADLRYLREIDDDLNTAFPKHARWRSWPKMD